VNLKDLRKQWGRAFEDESEKGVEVYRPAGYAFKPARGREELDLRSAKGGLSKAGPDDKTSHIDGVWVYDAGDNTLEFKPANDDGPARRYDVMECTEERLVLKRR
jgi:hypothetical protein